MRVSLVALCCLNASLAACGSADDTAPIDRSDASADVTTGGDGIDVSRDDAHADTTAFSDSASNVAPDVGTETATDAASDVPRDATARSICPMPTNTGTVDVSALTCPELATKYAEAVTHATACGCNGDCSMKVCETFCCNCETFINPGSEAYATVTSIKEAWTAKACTAGICSKLICANSSSLGCTAEGSDSGKACGTSHGT